MNDFIYLWIDKYRPFKQNEEKQHYLYENTGVSLSSKYLVKHVLDEYGKIEFFIDEYESKIMFSDNFYSGCISDLKVIVGKNGVGKSSLIDFLRDSVSGNHNSDNIRYCLLYVEDSEQIRFVAKNVDVKGIFYKDSEIPLDDAFVDSDSFSNSVMTYSAAYNDEWHYIASKNNDSSIFDLSTKFLLQHDAANYRFRKNSPINPLVSHSVMDTIRQVNFVSDFLNEDDFLGNIFQLPDCIIFTLSTSNIRNIVDLLINKLGGNPYEISSIESSFLKTNRRKVSPWNQLQFAFTVRCLLDYENLPQELNILKDNLRKMNFENDGGYVINKIWTLMGDSFVKKANPLLNFFEKHIDSKNGNFSFSLSKTNEDIKTALDIVYGDGSIPPIMDVMWNRQMSSGESCYLKLFARFYDAILKTKGNSNWVSFPLLVDEVDLYLHPEWQRMWFARFVKGLELIREKTMVDLKIQLILTTHSPFMLTDFSEDNVVRLYRDNENNCCQIENGDVTSFIAGNIYDVLKDGFFLKGTMGEFTEQKIKNIISRRNADKSKKTSISAAEKYLVEHIGDSVIKTILSRQVELK